MPAGRETHRLQRPATAALAVLGSAWYLLLMNRGINMPDEGVQMLYGYQVSAGMVTYRDYFVPVAPLGFMIQALLIKIFGAQLMVGRAYVAFQGAISLALCARLSARRIRFPFSLVPPLLFIPFTVALGGFPTYNLDAAFFLFLCLYFADGFVEDRSDWRIFVAAFLGACSAAAKQNMLLAALPLVALALWFARGGEKAGLRRSMLAAASGFAAPPAILFIRFARARALGEAWACLTSVGGMKREMLLGYLPPALGILALGVGSAGLLVWLSRKASAQQGGAVVSKVQWLWPASVAAGLAGLLMGFPPYEIFLLSVIAVSLLVFVRPGPGDSRDNWTLIRAHGLLLFAATIISGMDLGHILIASAGAALPAGLLLQKVFDDGWPRTIRAASLMSLAAVFFVGIYLDLAVPHLEYTQGPRWRATEPVEAARARGVRAAPEKAGAIADTVEWIESNTEPGEKIFVYPWDLLLYFLSDRMPATYDTFLYYEIFDQAILNRVLSDLESARPGVAVVLMEDGRMKHFAPTPRARAMEGYLRSNYREGPSFGQYKILLRVESGP